ncbi:MAG: hypothetical protein IPK66_15490 [Rhodospirillales bacterium]|nr:hypothetical protein [Rhodospirillales bacterium]
MICWIGDCPNWLIWLLFAGVLVAVTWDGTGEDDRRRKRARADLAARTRGFVRRYIQTS